MDAERVAWVTGGSGGIGLAVARRLAADGCRVALSARSEDALERARADLEGAGAPGALALPCDVADPASVDAALARLVETWGRVDVLVNAAGTNRPGLFLRAKPEDWEAVLRTNLTGVALPTRAALGPMRKQRGGAVVTIASLGARAPREGMSAYCASKAALLGLLGSVRKEVARAGIRVTTILPGEVDTAMHGDDDAERAARRIRPEDVAEAVAFVLRLSERTDVPELELHERAAG